MLSERATPRKRTFKVEIQNTLFNVLEEKFSFIDVYLCFDVHEGKVRSEKKQKMCNVR